MKKYSYFLFLFSFIILYFFYLYLYAYNNIAINSDTVSPMLMLDDILKGNFILEGWTGSTYYFLTQLYFFNLVPYNIFGLTKYLYLYYPAFVLTLLMVLILILVLKNSKDMKVTLFLYFTLLVILPNGSTAYLFTAHFHHNETYLTIFANLILIYFIYNSENKKKAILLSTILFIVNTVTYSDGIAYYIYALPLIMVILFNIVYIILKPNSRLKLYNLLLILISTVLSLTVNKIIEILVKSGGGIYQAGFKKIAFSNPADWNDRLKASLEFLLQAFNFKSFNHPLDIVSLLIFIICVFYLFKTLINIRRVDIIQQFLAVSSLLFFIANIVSYVNLANRYFIIIGIMMIVLFIYSNPLEDIKSILKNKKIYKVISIFLIILCTLFMIRNIRTEVRDISSFDDRKNIIKEIVLKHDLKHGYATFWHAAVFSFYSGPETIVAPINFNSKNLVQMKWLSKDKWYKTYANFIVTVPSEVDKFYKVLGKPKYEYRDLPKIHHEKTIILVYDKNITEYLPNHTIKKN